MKKIIIAGIAISIIFSTTACNQVTYPKEKIGETVIKLCEDEYNIKVDVSIIGKTLAVYMPLSNLFDIMTFQISEDAYDKIHAILLIARRIAFSSDADIQFYCIIAQDTRFPQIQFVIIRYIDDVKRTHYLDISLGESSKRMLRDINETPQAKKEEAIQQVFEKMELGQEWQDKVLEDFFRSPPTSLEGIGYWDKRFYVKDITLEEFLAQQMASRIKMRFSEKEELNRYNIRSVTGKFITENGKSIFSVNFRVDTLLFVVDAKEKQVIQKEIFSNMFEEISDVIYGYKFKDFDLIRITEKNFDTKILVPEENIYLFKKHKIGLDTVLGMLN